MITQAQVQAAADLVNQSNLTTEHKAQVLETLAGLQCDVDQRFQELVEANRWVRIIREQRDTARKAISAKTTQDNSPESRRAAMQKAKLAAMATGKTTAV